MVLRLVLAVVVICFTTGVVTWLIIDVSANHFQHWYPQYDRIFRSILQSDCHDELYVYTTTKPPDNCKECLVSSVISCILSSDNLGEADKAYMAAAGIVLGLLPTILGCVGPTTFETGLLYQRRPILAFLISLGSPGISLIRSIDSNGPEKLLRVKPRDLPTLRSQKWRIAMIIVQYIVVMASVVNVIHVSYELSINSLYGFEPRGEWYPLVWFLLTIPLHIVGAIEVALNLDLRSEPSTTSTAQSMHLADIFRYELQLCQVQPKFVISRKKDTHIVCIVAWIVRTFAVVHMVFGTVTFSTALFIPSDYGLFVVARFILSTCACQIVLMMEMHGLRILCAHDEDESNLDATREEFLTVLPLNSAPSKPPEGADFSRRVRQTWAL